MAEASQSAGGANTDIATQSKAEAAVTTLATAVETLSKSQAVVGRGQNNLQLCRQPRPVSDQQPGRRRSRASRDADLANEAANMTKAQILLQAGVAALAQANSAPQQVLWLLRS